MPSITDYRTFNESKLYVGEEVVTKKKDGVEYGRMKMAYNNERIMLLLKSKTMGIKTAETNNGYQRRTMPFVFDHPFTKNQKLFVDAFDKIINSSYHQLLGRQYDETRLQKLGSGFWAEKILYANIASSMWDSSDNTRFFLEGREVSSNEISDSTDYNASAAILLDSIYVGESAISIQIRLYEVHLTPAEKRAIVVWD